MKWTERVHPKCQKIGPWLLFVSRALFIMEHESTMQLCCRLQLLQSSECSEHQEMVMTVEFGDQQRIHF